MRVVFAIVTATQAIACGRVAFDHGAPSDGASDVVIDVLDTQPGLIGRWLLDETGGTSARDALGAIDGVLIAGGSGLPMRVTGHRGNALGFVGDGDRVLMGTPPIAGNLAALSVTAWVMPSSITVFGGDHAVVDKGDTGVGWAFGISIVADGDLWFRGVFPNGTAQRSSLAGQLAVGRWTHIAASWDGQGAGTGITLYIDGNAVAIATNSDATGPRANDNAITLAINNNSTAGYTGVIDDVQLYDRVLTAGEIAAMYAATQ